MYLITFSSELNNHTRIHITFTQQLIIIKTRCAFVDNNIRPPIFSLKKIVNCKWKYQNARFSSTILKTNTTWKHHVYQQSNRNFQFLFVLESIHLHTEQRTKKIKFRFTPLRLYFDKTMVRFQEKMLWSSHQRFRLAFFSISVRSHIYATLIQVIQEYSALKICNDLII